MYAICSRQYVTMSRTHTVTPQSKPTQNTHVFFLQFGVGGVSQQHERAGVDCGSLVVAVLVVVRKTSFFSGHHVNPDDRVVSICLEKIARSLLGEPGKTG